MTGTPTSSRPLRVLCVTNMWPRPDHRSYGTFVESQMRSMVERGVSVRVHVVDGRHRRFAYLRSALRMFGLNFGLRRYDLVHAHTGHCGAVARLQWRYPVLLSFVGYDVYGKPTDGDAVTVKSRVEALAFRHLARACRRTITKSEEMESLLPRSARGRNVVLPNGVDHGRFRPMDRGECRARLGWPPDEPVVLFAGNPDVPRKRYALARTAFERTRHSAGGARLRVLWGVDPQDVPVWMNASDVVLLTSSMEGSPNVVKEAAACNLPIVATDVGDVREVLSGIDGCHVCAGDAGEIARCIELALDRAPRRTDGRERTAHLEIGAIARRLEQIYHDCLHERPVG